MHTTLADWLATARDPSQNEGLDVSVAAADARFAAFGTDPEAIPSGSYCYFGRINLGKAANGAPMTSTVPCPFWAANPDAPEQGYGYCAKLRSGDWEDAGTSLLWDQCKECGVKNDWDDEEQDTVHTISATDCAT